jgi:hypothetical protein
MLIDSPPREPKLMAFNESDRMRTIRLPDDTVLPMIAKSMEAGMKDARIAHVRRACQKFLDVSSNFYGVSRCGVRVLAARPLRVRENWSSELFGDYAPDANLIRVWMRTAVKKEVTSFGTFLSTLCHEFCHHLDLQQFKFPDSWHTRGFYERAAALYHYARETAPKKLFWVPVSGGRWRIDWPLTNRGAS